MNSSLTTEQILALAPDSASGKAGQALASPAKWVTLGCKDGAVWGECQGSGAKPYQVQIDLSEPAFQCSCPSRKFPCKHGLGLFLVFANNRAAVMEEDCPAWVAEWHAKREEKADKQKKAAEVETPKSEADLEKAAAEQGKRAAQRRKKVAQGLEDLQLWLCDLVRHGVASVQSRPYKFWDEPAGRLVDAQAPGVARMVREMGSLAASGEGWQERLVEHLGLLTLLLEAYRRIDTLPEPVQADVRDAIGWSVRQETVLTTDAVPDVWSVLGQRSYDEDQFRVTRTWLRGQNGRDALLLQFTRPGQPIEILLAPGSQFEAEVVFYPGAWPLRALIKTRNTATVALQGFLARPNIADLLDAYSDALGRNPWIGVFPAAIGALVPAFTGSVWTVRDRGDQILPVSRAFEHGWKLMGISGGHPVDLFGEWNGAEFLPLSAWHQGRLVLLT